MANLTRHLVFFSFLLLQAAFVLSQLSCPPSYCGNLQIKFPLWLKNSSSSNPTDYYCGFPDLGIDCQNGTAILHAGNDTFVVEFSAENNIGYIFQDRDLLSSSCPRARHNLTLDSVPRFPLRLGGSFSIFFYFNCTVKDHPLPPGYVPLPLCIRNGEGKESFAVWSDGTSKFAKSEGLECEDIVESPVKKFMESWNLNSSYAGALQAGFEMVVSDDVARQCGECEGKRGTCTYATRGTGERMYEFNCMIGRASRTEGLTQRIKIIIGLAAAGGFTLSFVVLTVCLLRRKRNKHDTIDMFADSLTLLKSINASIDQHGELISFDFSTIALATKNFSSENKIGAGGFGDVYKGILGDGQTVAVKRISFQSEERINEFVMEVKLIAKLQHRNLVRLLGYCIKGSERLLIYEFVPNKSLDFFIFGNEEKRQLLDWEKRISIIMGVARGLLYLHQDSRLRVIHRDLKAANILLDDNMNPKISDFGTARIFEHEQVDDNTIKIVGTRGYMSPEYIMNENFSEKSDVFSFGVLALEITSGRRNKWLSQENNCMELLSNAWILCMENEIHKLLDTTLNRPTHLETVIRVIKVGLLCVQESPNARPTMQEVVLMLVKEHIALSQPKRPGFFQYISVSTAFDCFPLAVDTRMTECQLTNTTLDGR